jgi:hypothetical protein
MGNTASPSRLYHKAFYFLLAIFLLLAVPSIDESCLDAADSAYLISSDAISRGLLPYRDFLAAHPPLLYMLGAPLAWIHAGIMPFRLFSILVLAGLGLAVFRLALKLSTNSGTAFLAGAFTLFAPLEIYFSKLFIQDALVSVIGVSAMILLLGGTRSRVITGGLLCVIGTLVKLTFLPLLLVFTLYVYRYRREHLKLFLAVAVAGSLFCSLALELVTGGAYFSDILSSQASKSYSFTNFYEGLHRIWQMDWPLILAAAPGLWMACGCLRKLRQDGRLFLLLGWLTAGMALLATLPAAGHDTNLFQLAEPAVALLAAWGIIGLAEKGKSIPVAAAVLLMIMSVVILVEKDRSFLTRSNAGDVREIVAAIDSRSEAGEAVLAPGCYALEAGRPVTRSFYDQFLWEEKYRRGDTDAIELFDNLRRDVSSQAIPVIVFEEDRDSLNIIGPELDIGYQESYQSAAWPPVTLWLPADIPPGAIR